MAKTEVGFSEGAEVVQLQFDPTVISYEALLEFFWASHDPTARNSRLYQNGVFTHNPQQVRLALQSKKALEKRLKRSVHSSIESANFSPARDSEQKYFLRQNSRLWSELSRVFPNPKALANSAVAAKVNGYLAGYGDQEQFQRYRNQLGLSQESLRFLQKRVPRKARHFVPQCRLP